MLISFDDRDQCPITSFMVAFSVFWKGNHGILLIYCLFPHGAGCALIARLLRICSNTVSACATALPTSCALAGKSMVVLVCASLLKAATYCSAMRSAVASEPP